VLTLWKELDNKNFVKSEGIITELKIGLLGHHFLQPQSSSEKEFLLCREVLECACLLSLLRLDLDGFLKSFSQLRPYYVYSFPPPSRDAPIALSFTPKESKHMGPFLAVHLFVLLILDHLGDFHLQYEQLPTPLKDHACIAYVMRLESFMMEGSYNSILVLGEDEARIPHPWLQRLTGVLINQRIRDAVAECVEAAYAEVRVSDLMRLLQFEREEELVKYVRERDGWIVKEREGVGMIEFVKGRKEKADGVSVSSEVMIGQMLHYARELDRIV